MSQSISETSKSPQPEAKLAPAISSNLSAFTKSAQKGIWVLSQIYIFLTQLFNSIGDLWKKYKQLVFSLVALAIILAVFRVASRVVNALNGIPLLEPTFQLIGIGYCVWFVQRYLLKASTRKDFWQQTQIFFNQLFQEIVTSRAQGQSYKQSKIAKASAQSKIVNVAPEGEEKEILVTSGQQPHPSSKFETPNKLVDEAIPSDGGELSNQQIDPINTTNQNEQVLYKPGEIVPTSGQYEVIGSDGSSQKREITSTKGEHFPPSPESGMHYKLVDKTLHGANQNQPDGSVIKADEIEQLFKPSETVPTSGQYAVINSDGLSIGRKITSTKGEHFPPSPEAGMHYKLVDATRHKE